MGASLGLIVLVLGSGSAPEAKASDGTMRPAAQSQDARFPVTVDPTLVRVTPLLGSSDPVSQLYLRFGTTASASGDTLVVGAPEEDTTSGTDAGAAYVFVRSGAAWIQQARLTASDAAARYAFGSSVSVSGDTAVVGAPLPGLSRTPRQ